VFIIFASLSLLFTACGSSESVIAGGDDQVSVTREAPTPAGETVEMPVQEVAAETILIGAASGGMIELRALPGTNSPVMGKAPAGSQVDTIQPARIGTRLQITADAVQGVWSPTRVVQSPLCANGVNSDGSCR